MGMTSRERLCAALGHESPDRVPIDLGGTWVTGISAWVYPDLKRCLEIEDGSTRVFDVFQMLAEVEEPVRQKLAIDTIPLRFRPQIPSSGASPEAGTGRTRWRQWHPRGDVVVEVPEGFCPVVDAEGNYVVEGEGRILAKMPSHGYHFEPAGYVLPALQQGAERVEIGAFRPEPINDEELWHLEKVSRSLYEETEYAIVGAFERGLFGNCIRTVGFEDWMTLLLTEPAYVSEVLSTLVDDYIRDLGCYAQAVGDRVAYLTLADDFGGQTGELISPTLFTELLAPHYERLFSWIHSNTKMLVFFHSCGSIYNLIEALIRCGVDILNPVQCTAARMDPKRLKREFGSRLVFCGGGCDPMTLQYGSPEAVRTEVRDRLSIFAPGGGYIFSQVHNILPKTPPENVVTMIDTVREFRVA